ncbi:hypothetical protein B0T22DRAFT_461563 [Podospora appendiculata]|uniref:Uncharacterized protein n=1 Tax=Podospora appendiculata TaxID=314037 RepID=A0AAE0XBL5_9PEZI|nr:hypothetical protein B0T22DRAFT_461563 [Podospora appendiculata]
MAFPQFALFPGEIQNMIWDYAATRSPSVHFLRNDVDDEHGVGDWLESELLLFPARQSAVLGLIHLAWTCRAAYAAVQRRNETVQHKTILRHGVSPSIRGKSLNLTLDFRSDLLCLDDVDVDHTNADDCCKPLPDPPHIVYTAARRLAIRYRPAVGGRSQGEKTLTGLGDFIRYHDLRGETFSTGVAQFVKDRGNQRPLPVCVHCLRNTLVRFDNLNELYLIVNEGNKTALDRDVQPSQRHNERDLAETREDVEREVDQTQQSPMFHSYSRTYFAPAASDACNELRDLLAALFPR